MNFKIHEIIKTTVQGEGYNFGIPIDLIRLYGCPVGCWFCDTGYSSNEEFGKNVSFERMDTEQLLNSISSKNILISGGEPFVNKNLKFLCSELINNGHQPFIETSGAYWMDLPVNVWITLSPKEHLNQKFAIDKRFWKRADEIKFVISKKDDFQFYNDDIKTLARIKLIYIQPEWSSKEQIIPYLLSLLSNNCNFKLSIQAHKFMNLP